MTIGGHNWCHEVIVHRTRLTVMRKNNSREKHIMLGQVEGRRMRGRPRNSFGSVMEHTTMVMEQLNAAIRDRHS